MRRNTLARDADLTVEEVPGPHAGSARRVRTWGQRHLADSSPWRTPWVIVQRDPTGFRLEKTTAAFYLGSSPCRRTRSMPLALEEIHTRWTAGHLRSISVSGYEAHTAKLKFAIAGMDGSKPQAFVVDYNAPPHVFSAMATLLALAYSRNLQIEVGYIPIADEAPTAIHVRLARLP